jgi:hypothetical protein
MNQIIGPTKVSIDFSCLQNNKLTADLYILLFCRYHSNCILPPIIEIATLGDDYALEYLESEGFVKITGDKEFALRQKAIELFESTNTNKDWLEFLGKFPMKVPNGRGGTRALKVADPDSKGNVRIRKKYLDLIKSSPELHGNIIKILEAEVKMRKSSNYLQYMHNMETWLNQADYDKYAYLLEDVSNDNYMNEDYM